jgi:ribonuclease P protein component
VRTSQIQRVFDIGRSLQAKRVIVLLAPGSGGLAVVASRRIGGAVERNRARRILRAAWHEAGLRSVDAYDVVLVAREAIRGAKTRDLVGEMTELLRRGELVST